MKERFECCFELEHKGIYFEVESNESHVDFTMFNAFEAETQVCLRNDDVDRLIRTLQTILEHQNP